MTVPSRSDRLARQSSRFVTLAADFCVEPIEKVKINCPNTPRHFVTPLLKRGFTHPGAGRRPSRGELRKQLKVTYPIRKNIYKIIDFICIKCYLYAYGGAL